MSEIETNETTQNETDTPDELSPEVEKRLLLDRAKVMGLKVSGNIGLETLRAKIKATIEADKKVADQPVEADESEEEEHEKLPLSRVHRDPPPEKPRELTKNELRRKIQKEALKLVRCRITCLNPQKKDLNGEIFAVANKYIGNVKKFVPFNNPEPYHLPQCLFDHLKDRKFLHIQTKKGPKGEIIVKTSDVNEFAIEVLPQLTLAELKKLAQRQAMAAGTQVEENEN